MLISACVSFYKPGAFSEQIWNQTAGKQAAVKLQLYAKHQIVSTLSIATQ